MGLSIASRLYAPPTRAACGFAEPIPRRNRKRHRSQKELELPAEHELGIVAGQDAQVDLIARGAVGQPRSVHGEFGAVALDVVVQADRELVEEVLGPAAGEDDVIFKEDEVIA